MSEQLELEPFCQITFLPLPAPASEHVQLGLSDLSRYTATLPLILVHDRGMGSNANSVELFRLFMTPSANVSGTVPSEGFKVGLQVKACLRRSAALARAAWSRRSISVAISGSRCMAYAASRSVVRAAAGPGDQFGAPGDLQATACPRLRG